MGQATADLPDPLVVAPVSSANTDDLLAQLAGEEIERLLAEADEVQAEPKASVVAVPPSPAQATQTPAPSAVSTLLKSPVTTEPVGPAPEADAAADADLDALFSGLETSGPKAAVVAPAVSTVVVADSEPSAADALAEEMAEDAATHSAGRSALAATSVASPTVTPANAPARVSGKGYSIPIYLWILKAISAPLDSYPEHVRDLVGKIAIMTTVNAAAVLAYVILFRHGH